MADANKLPAWLGQLAGAAESVKSACVGWFHTLSDDERSALEVGQLAHAARIATLTLDIAPELEARGTDVGERLDGAFGKLRLPQPVRLRRWLVP